MICLIWWWWSVCVCGGGRWVFQTSLHFKILLERTKFDMCLWDIISYFGASFLKTFQKSMLKWKAFVLEVYISLLFSYN